MKKLASLRNNPVVGCLLLVFTAIGGLALILVFHEKSISKIFDDGLAGFSLFDDDETSSSSPEIVLDNDEDYLGI